MFGSKPVEQKSSSTKIGGFSLKTKKISQEEKAPSGKIGLSGTSVPKNTSYYHEYSYDVSKLPPMISGMM